MIDSDDQDNQAYSFRSLHDVHLTNQYLTSKNGDVCVWSCDSDSDVMLDFVLFNQSRETGWPFLKYIHNIKKYL